MIGFLKTVTVEWPAELQKEWKEMPGNLAKIGQRLGMGEVCRSCSSPRKADEEQV